MLIGCHSPSAARLPTCCSSVPCCRLFGCGLISRYPINNNSVWSCLCFAEARIRNLTLCIFCLLLHIIVERQGISLPAEGMGDHGLLRAIKCGIWVATTWFKFTTPSLKRPDDYRLITGRLLQSTVSFWWLRLRAFQELVTMYFLHIRMLLWLLFSTSFVISEGKSQCLPSTELHHIPHNVTDFQVRLCQQGKLFNLCGVVLTPDDC